MTCNTCKSTPLPANARAGQCQNPGCGKLTSSRAIVLCATCSHVLCRCDRCQQTMRQCVVAPVKPAKKK